MVCSIINKYRPPLSKIDDEKNAKQMLELVDKRNELISIVQSRSRRVRRENKVNYNEIDFPSLTEEYLKAFTFGIYQIKQVFHYNKLKIL